MKDPRTGSLYVFPLKGLEQDQVKNLNELSTLLGLGDSGIDEIHSYRGVFGSHVAQGGM